MMYFIFSYHSNIQYNHKKSMETGGHGNTWIDMDKKADKM